MATYDRFVSELGSTAPQGTGTPWMRALSEHYLGTRDRFPDGDLCIVFDIDGTIVDMRHHIAHVLLGYDRLHGTQHFQGLVAPEIVHHEDDVAGLLSSFGVPIGERAAIARRTTEGACGTTRRCAQRPGPSKGYSG